MKKIMIIILLTSGINSFAQTDARKEALELMRKLVKTYAPLSGLSFDIAYKYSMEKTPGVYLDSLSGQCKIMGDRYWYQLDSTESIKTSDYLVMVFREDEVIYLAKPSANMQANNPLAMIDSLLFQNNKISFEVKNEKLWQNLVMNFPAGSAYKKIEYRIDKLTGFLTNMIAIVKNEASEYAIVESRFFNYKLGQMDQTVFDANRYFRKNGSEYIAVAPFEQYKVFLGSPGL